MIFSVPSLLIFVLRSTSIPGPLLRSDPNLLDQIKLYIPTDDGTLQVYLLVGQSPQLDSVSSEMVNLINEYGIVFCELLIGDLERQLSLYIF